MPRWLLIRGGLCRFGVIPTRVKADSFRGFSDRSESDSLAANRRFAMRPGIALRPDYDAAQLWALVLQLSLRVGFALMALPVTVLGHGLMDAPPQRPAEEMIEHYAGRTLQAANELADLAHAEGDQRSRLRSPLLCDVTALSFTRRAARKPKASMASVMCRYQPCQERIS